MQRIHGLIVDAEPPLPGFVKSGNREVSDVIVRLADTLPPPHNPVVLRYESVHDDSTATVRILDDARGLTCFRYSDGTAIDVDTQRRPVQVTATIPAAQTIADLTVYLAGPVFGFVLRNAGVLALHASAIAIDGEVILVVGESGTGKSTTAAAMAERGHEVLSDDLTALSLSADRVRAHAAFDHVRLWAEGAALVLEPGERLERITPTWEKLRFPIATPLDATLPVSAIVVLAADGATFTSALQRLGEGDAVVTVATHTYSNYLLTPPMRAHELHQLGEVVSRVPVYRVSRGDGVRALAELCNALVEVVRTSGVQSAE